MENNQWHFHDCKKQYYKINENTYDAKIYYYIISFKKYNKVKAKKIGNNNKYIAPGSKSEEGIDEITEQKEKRCLAGILEFFSFSKE